MVSFLEWWPAQCFGSDWPDACAGAKTRVRKIIADPPALSPGRIKPGKVFDLTLPLSEVAEGYRAMDDRRSIKTLLTV